jgi:MFS family permease
MSAHTSKEKTGPSESGQIEPTSSLSAIEIPSPTTSEEIQPKRRKRSLKKRILRLPVINALYDYYYLLSHRKIFFYLWVSGLVSTFGCFFSQLAITNLIEHGDYAGSGTAISGIFLASYLPSIILMPLTGVVADTYDRRKVMILSDTLRVFVVLSFMYVLFVPRLHWPLYLLLALQMAFNSFFDPCREAIIPLAVKRRELLQASALDGFTWMFCSFVGSSMGGVIVSALGTGANFAIGASTFVVSAFFVLNLFRFPKLKPGHGVPALLKQKEEKANERTPIAVNEVTSSKNVTPSSDNDRTQGDEELPTAYHTQQGGLLRGMWEQVVTFVVGVRYVFKRPYILSLVFIKALSALLWGAQDLLNVKLCFEVFINDGQMHDPAWAYGLIEALMGCAWGLAPILVERILPQDVKPRTMRVIVLASYLALVPAFSILYASQTVIALICTNVLVATACGVHWLLSSTMIQQTVPNNFIGRVISFDMGLNLNVALTLTSLLFGLVLVDVLKFEAHDCSLTLLIGAGICGLVAILWFFAFFRVDSHDCIPVDDSGNDIPTEEQDQADIFIEGDNAVKKKRRNSATLMGKFFGHAKEYDLTGEHEPVSNWFPASEHKH